MVGDQPGGVLTVTQVEHFVPLPGDDALLVDSTGAVVVRSRLLPQELFDEAWPLTLLRTSGVPAREEGFASTRVLQQAHRGAAPLWLLTAGFGWFLLTVLVVVLALLGVVALLVAVLT